MVVRLVLTLVLASLPALVLSRVAARAELPSGAVYVTTLPSGADVWVDGTYVGHAPVLVDALLRGHHSVTLVKAGWSVQEVDVDVRPGTVSMSSTRLAAVRATFPTATGTLTIRGAATGAMWLDDQSWDPNARQPTKLAAGTHRLTYTTARGRISQAFTVYPDTTTEVVLREPPSGQEERSGVIAAAADYLPQTAFSVDGKRIVVRYAGHFVVAYMGETAVRYDGSVETYAGVPEAIAGKLYLPLALLEKLSAEPPSKK